MTATASQGGEISGSEEIFNYEANFFLQIEVYDLVVYSCKQTIKIWIHQKIVLSANLIPYSADI